MEGSTLQVWLNQLMLHVLENDVSSQSSTSVGLDIAMPSMVLALRPRTRSCYDDYILSEESMELQLQMKRDMLRRCKSLEARTKQLWP